jgi:hypothetical protein
MSFKLLVPMTALLVLANCQDPRNVTGPEPGPAVPVLAIVDGAHNGPAGFYFLPPLVDAPVHYGTFDGALSPEIRICALAGSSCCEPDLAVLSTGGSGASSIIVDLDEEAYVALWLTKGLGLDPNTDYRIRVFVGDLQLGALDLDVVAGPQERKGVASDMVGLVKDRPLPIKFRIETGIVGQVVVEPSSATVPVGQTQQFIPTFKDLHGATLMGPSVTWTSSNNSVATVDGSGLATGVGEGSVTITAATEWVSGTAALQVLPAELTWAAGTPTTEGLRDVWGSSGSDVFAVGTNGTILHYDGSAWAVMTTPEALESCSITGVWGSSSDHVFATFGGNTGCGGVLQYNGSLWSVVLETPVQDQDYFSPMNHVWGSGPDDVYAVGYDGLLAHWDGTSWNTNDLSGVTEGSPIPLSAIWGSSGSDIFVACQYGFILHYDGSAWSPTFSDASNGPSFYGVWGSSGNDVFVVGGERRILHYDGTGWTEMETGSGILWDVWGSSGSDVFTVGTDGTILHYDGDAWSAVEKLPASASTEDLFGIWGSSDSDIFVVGSDGLILHGTK